MLRGSFASTRGQTNLSLQSEFFVQTFDLAALRSVEVNSERRTSGRIVIS